MRLTSLLVPLVLIASEAAASYVASCRNCISGRDVINFSCSCRRIDGSYAGTSIDLGDCFQNSRGVITFGRGGRFERSCDNVRLEVLIPGDQGVGLRADCGDGAGGRLPNLVYLNHHLHNDNGRLACRA